MSGPATAEKETDLGVGTILGDRYRIDSLLGEGAMGKVYLAEHVLMKKRLAVKVLHRELSSVPEVVARCEREAMAAANIDHPNVAGATDFAKLPDGTVFLVLEFVEGRSLRDEISTGPMPVARSLHICRQIASALAAAHRLEIVHRDLKPENVMLVDKGGDGDFVKVLDFGIAKVGTQGSTPEEASSKRIVTKVGMVFGTPEYMPPEQALGEAVDQRADLYSLGVMLYEMMTGVRPFGGTSQVNVLARQLSESPQPPSLRAPDRGVPPAVDALVMKLLERDMVVRVQTAVDLVRAIDALLGRSQSASWPDLVRGSVPDAYPTSVPELLAAAPVAPSIPSNVPLPSAPRASPPSSFDPPSLARIEASVERASLVASQGLDRVYEWVDAHKKSLPPPMQAPLRAIPAPVLLGGILLLVLLGGFAALALGGVVFGSRSAPSASAPIAVSAPIEPSAVAPPPALAAPDAELALAKQGGSGALESLRGRFPKDARVMRALLKSYQLDKKHLQAVGIARELLDADAGAKDDPEMSSALWVLAQSRESSDAAFELLQGPMGSRGADIVYDLVTTDGVRAQVVTRAEQWLATRDFERVSSPALHLAVSLRHTKTCEERQGLLLRAKNAGDKRALKYLRPFENKTGCGKRGRDDCNPCLRGDDALAQAIDAIEKREAG